jgi:signal transduction histidine kinase
MNLFAFAGLLLGIVCFVFVFVILKNKKTELHSAWAAFNIAVGLWGFGACIIGLTKDQTVILQIWKFTEINVIFISVCFFHVTYILCGLKNKKLLLFAYAQGIFFSILSITTNLIFGGTVFVFDSFYYATPGSIFFHLFFAIWLLLVSLSSYYLFKAYFTSRGQQRVQIQYFIMGTLAGFSGGISNFLPHFNINVYPFGNLSIVLYCFIVTYAIVRYQLLDIRIVVTRAGILLLLYTCVLGLPFYIGFKTKSWALSTSFAVILASIGPLLYKSLQKKAENILLAEQRRYQKILTRAASGMAKEHDLHRLLQLIVYIVKKTVKINFAASFLDDKENKVYRLMAIRERLKDKKDIVLPYDHPLIKYIQKREDPVLTEELPDEVRAIIDLPFKPSLIVPSYYENRAIGFLMLGEKINNKLYTTDDISVFRILAQQSAMAVENCIFVEGFKKAQERVFNAEKLASIGGMADGVAHQIKNRLNVFSVAAGEQMFEIDDFVRDHAELVEQNPDLKKTFGYLHETAESLVVNVKKTTSIIRGILNFAKVEERETMFSEFALMEIIEQCVNLLLVKHQVANIPVEADIPADSLLYGVKAQIMESVYNLIDNAYEAIREKMEYHLDENAKQGFKPLIKVQLIQKGTTSMIEVADNGMGIKEEHKKKIFAPFFTTKASSKSGSGIGMYVVRRMIEENHGGKIRIESEYGKGTRTVIEIPRKAASADEAGMGKTA